MRSRPVSATILVAMLCGGCATGRQLRVHAERGAPLVAKVAASELGPATGLVLVNPVVCLELTRGGGGGDTFGAVVLLAAIVGCAGILGAVDLVALPVQAVRRSHQQRDLEAIGLACPLDDPAARVGPELAARMIAEYGFSPAPPSAPATSSASAPGDEAAPGDGAAVQLLVRTKRFVRSSRVSWEGHVDFVDPAGQHIWGWACASHTPQRAADTFEGECEAARAEISALADQCVDGVTRVLRQRWPGWAPKASEPQPEGAPEAAVPSMIPGW